VALPSLIMGIEAHPVRGEGYPESHQYLLSKEKKRFTLQNRAKSEFQ